MKSVMQNAGLSGWSVVITIFSNKFWSAYPLTKFGSVVFKKVGEGILKKTSYKTFKENIYKFLQPQPFVRLKQDDIRCWVENSTNITKENNIKGLLFGLSLP